MWPHVGAGPGGSTQLWHNGLIEIEASVFERGWPFPKSELDAFYASAFQLLSGLEIGLVRAAIEDLAKRYRALGLPADGLPGLFYPQTPMNVWQALGLANSVKLVQADVVGVELREGESVRALQLRTPGQTQRLEGDVFVFAAGGLGTPVLLQTLAAAGSSLPALQHAGLHYEDHPMGFVGEVEVTVPLYRLWNFRVPGTDGNLRLPFVVRRPGIDISFQLRPAATYYRDTRRQRVGTVLNELRRAPWNLWNYFKLFAHWDDVLDILSFKFGVHWPTRHYTLLMMAEMPPQLELAIVAAEGKDANVRHRERRWVLTSAYRQELSAAIDELLEQLQPVVRRANLFPNWWEELRTGAHHSGTARMSVDAARGVCDADCRVHGVGNLYVCDGAVIPASGVANTGLTIAALALRLAAHLQARR
ncbi:hypothetical protein EOE66_04575 [Rubrivivax rivuli]|uniref:Glucose-methanol-choline oxidoreductase C-terminal domain-containing protein n=2 Tax=Rubrivivax rivuli TaxID=1862385 RepID=A0A437RT58_9BURK|nr:hypothetical protein EOE66_04575 [Rubrivivax rivuli]